MTIRFNHTIVNSRDKKAGAAFLAGLFGLPDPVSSAGWFMAVQVGDVTFDFCDADGAIEPQHYAFQVDDAEFEAIFARIRERGLAYWADPGKRRAGEINHHNGGRGVYFEDPSGHFLEILTRP